MRRSATEWNVHNRRPKAFTEESVEAFAAEYVTLKEIADRMGLAPPQAMRRLNEAGIRDAVRYDQVHMKLYRRRDLPADRLTGDAV